MNTNPLHPANASEAYSRVATIEAALERILQGLVVWQSDRHRGEVPAQQNSGSACADGYNLSCKAKKCDPKGQQIPIVLQKLHFQSDEREMLEMDVWVCMCSKTTCPSLREGKLHFVCKDCGTPFLTDFRHSSDLRDHLTRGACNKARKKRKEVLTSENFATCIAYAGEADVFEKAKGLLSSDDKAQDFIEIYKKFKRILEPPQMQAGMTPSGGDPRGPSGGYPRGPRGGEPSGPPGESRTPMQLAELHYFDEDTPVLVRTRLAPHLTSIAARHRESCLSGAAQLVQYPVSAGMAVEFEVYNMAGTPLELKSAFISPTDTSLKTLRGSTILQPCERLLLPQRLKLDDDEPWCGYVLLGHAPSQALVVLISAMGSGSATC
mmetsp:Transcript_7861/g.15616  ORF Transcript_7861/g.15616 Transcript_7861/m.15616 type:complete len:379 (-) Transcript_7861:53-1189(-)